MPSNVHVGFAFTVAHSSAKAVKNAIRFAAEFSRQNLAEKIQGQIAELHSREERLAKA